MIVPFVVCSPSTTSIKKKTHEKILKIIVAFILVEDEKLRNHQHPTKNYTTNQRKI